MLPHLLLMGPRCRAVNEESPAFRRGECQAIYWLTIAIMLDVADKVSGAVHVNVMCVLTFECLALSAYLYKRIAKII